MGPDTIQNHKGSSLDAIPVQPQNFPLGWNDVLKMLGMVRPPEHPTRNYLVLLYSLRPPEQDFEQSLEGWSKQHLPEFSGQARDNLSPALQNFPTEN